MIKTVETGSHKDLKRAISVYTGQDGRILANRISVSVPPHVCVAAGPLVLSFAVGLLPSCACLHICFRSNARAFMHIHTHWLLVVVCLKSSNANFRNGRKVVEGGYEMPVPV